MRRFIFNTLAAISLLLCVGFLVCRLAQGNQWRFFGAHSWHNEGGSQIRRSLYIELHHGVYIFWFLISSVRPDAPPTVGHFTYDTTTSDASPWPAMDTPLERAGFCAQSDRWVRKAEVADAAWTNQWILTAPSWFVVIAFGLLPSLWIGRVLARRRQARRARIGLCAGCGYDLRASPDRCPECGRLRDANLASTPS